MPKSFIHSGNDAHMYLKNKLKLNVKFHLKKEEEEEEE